MPKIKNHILDAIYRHALSEYPNECCGIVVGKKGVADSFEMSFPCRNLQDEMHEKEPECFTRTAKTAYFLSPKDLFEIQRITRERGMEMKMIYHSHVDVGSYFSDEDKKQATYEGNPAFPGVVYLVADVTKDNVRGSKIFGWNSEKKDFLELV